MGEWNTVKVVQINSYCGIGSTGRIAVEISKKLDEVKYENYIFYGVGDSEYKNGIKFGGLINVRLHQIATRLFGKHGFYSKIATKKLVKKLKEIDPDIVHLHNIHGHYINVEILFDYLFLKNKKIVWTLHDCWSFTGHCAYFEYNKCEKWKKMCENCPALKDYPKSLIFDRSKESFLDKKRIFTKIENLTLITPSNWLAMQIKQSFLKNKTVIVINNGIDLELFKPKKNDIKEKFGIENKFVILGVASYWSKRKGFRYFLELSELLEENEIIILVGINDKQLKKLPKNIIGLKRTNSIDELASIYSASDVFINPTLEDNFPTTNIESLACGTPVITFNSGGSSEAIDKKTGITVEKGKTKELRAAITSLRKKKITVEDCVTRAKLFNKEERYDEYINIYQKVIRET